MAINAIDLYTIELVRKNPNYIFVYGDNLISKGRRGQAIIRDEPNTFGIPTKRYPSMAINAFFNDREDEVLLVTDKLLKLVEIANTKDIILPKAGIGSGLAELPTRSPKIYQLISYFLLGMVSVEYTANKNIPFVEWRD